MLLRTHKLTRRRDIEKLAKTGKGLRSVFFIFKILPNKLEKNRWVIIVSTKVSKKAVIRNRLRRQVREIIRLNFLDDKMGLDIMVIVKNNAIGVDYKDLEKDLLFFYEKIKKQKNKTY